MIWTDCTLNRFLKRTGLHLILLISFTILGTPILRGSHIVGGEITYKFLQRESSKLQYRFTMKIYRDLFLSNANANFDDPARISIYLMSTNGAKLYGNDNNGRVILVPIKSRTRVVPPEVPCLTPPSNIGVEEAIYEWDATLYDTTFSYVISYQRCCRNNDVVNIRNSGTTGATYTIEITPESQHLNNSSPTFKTFPPIFICGGEPLKYDHSAVDTEGDQLVYKFCSPVIGGTSNNPTPSVPAAPPYSMVTFKQPTYTQDRPMAGEPLITIGVNDGEITGTPTTLGQYVIGVCVEEYRNGKLLSKISRDFQFVVAECIKNVSASISADSSSVNGGSLIKKEYFINGCENITLQLDNQSKERSQINSFYWEFNNKGTIERYTEWSPTVTFRDTGLYIGKLVLNPGLPCGDSALVKVQLGGRVETDLKINYDTCVAGAVSFKGTAISAYPLKQTILDYGDGQKDTNRLITSHEYTAPGLKQIRFSSVDKYGCKGDTALTLRWEPAPPIIVVEPDNFKGCAPGKVFFNNRSKPIDSTYNIKWDFGDGTFSNAISPTHIYSVPDTYSVKLSIVSPIGCRKEAVFSNWIKIRNTPKADFDWSPKRITSVHPEISFSDQSYLASHWQWFIGQEAYSSKTNPIHTFRDTGLHKVTLIVRNTEGCTDSMVKDVYVFPEVLFYLPNAFTPNYDTKNDEFKCIGSFIGVHTFKFTIWNRWGEIVFQTQNPEDGWNGKKNNVGSLEPEGVYLYEILYATNLDSRVSKRGYVTLVR